MSKPVVLLPGQKVRRTTVNLTGGTVQAGDVGEVRYFGDQTDMKGQWVRTGNTRRLFFVVYWPTRRVLTVQASDELELVPDAE